MNKPELEKHLTNLREAIAETLRRIRAIDGDCDWCHARVGEPHTQACVVWPLIEARSDYAREADT